MYFAEVVVKSRNHLFFERGFNKKLYCNREIQEDAENLPASTFYK